MPLKTQNPMFYQRNIPQYALWWSVIFLSSFFLFKNLGYYALWDDESVSALVANGIQRTGDTSAFLDHNIVAYRSGLLVRDGKDRSTPPLSTYLTAGAFSLLGVDAFSARLPSAIFGIGTIVLLIWFCKNYTLKAQSIFYLGLLGNVSMFLFCRQARYYAAGLFFSTLIAFMYLRWRGSCRGAMGMALIGVFLFATNYLAYVALAICLFIDWILWRREEISWNIRNFLALFLPQFIIIPCIANIWNPFATGFGKYVAKNSFWDRVEIFFWNLRDLNSAEFIVGPLLFAGFFLAWRHRDKILTRMLLSFLVYVGFVSLVSPQTISNTSVADVRYLVPIIPLAVGASSIVILQLTRNYHILGIGLALLVFQTNILNGGPILASGIRSTIAEFAHEIVFPLQEPYSIVSDWIGKNICSGESVAIFPDYMVYPLMFHNPCPTYAWQLKNEVVGKSPFGDVPDIHWEGRCPPDYFVIFGPAVVDFLKVAPLWNRRGWHYEHLATINAFWKDLYRPELFWRTFRPIGQFDPDLEAIQIFRKVQQNDSL